MWVPCSSLALSGKQITLVIYNVSCSNLIGIGTFGNPRTFTGAAPIKLLVWVKASVSLRLVMVWLVLKRRPRPPVNVRVWSLLILKTSSRRMFLSNNVRVIVVFVLLVFTRIICLWVMLGKLW